MRPGLLGPAWTLLKAVEHTGQRMGLDLEPPDARVRPPPSQLAPRVAAVGAGHRVGQFLVRELAADVRHSFRVADASEHRGVLRDAGIERRLRFRDEAALDLPAAA